MIMKQSCLARITPTCNLISISVISLVLSWSLSCCIGSSIPPPADNGANSIITGAGGDTTTFITGNNAALPPLISGCQLTYLDENFQPFALDAAVALTTNQSSSSSVAPQLARYVITNTGGQQQQQQQQQQQVSITSNSSAKLIQPTNIGLDCQYITAEQLHDKFNRIKAFGLRVSSLVVKDSTLTTLGNLPQGFHELRKLVISNTSIDLEVLKEGSESLDQLTTLEITNEKISNIPQNFFQEMQSLRELRLENDEIASLDGDAFHNLDDSLEVLVLRHNRFNRFPMAVKNLAQLAVLDLSDNDIVIDTQENDLPEKLEPLLNLRELVMNRINCTCEFSSSPFFEWIARTHISGVRCFAPDKLKSQEVIVFERDEFCVRQSSSGSSSSLANSSLLSLQNCLTLVLCQLISRASSVYNNHKITLA